ncbi:hypothetical protein [Myxococcus sp. NMCA1]|uniref:hypothetical protein n=1 Tax=Myxococcus sp. NMCA1 TaxID=2996785 RepID=UPI0022860BA3|nr:hypothetical protein [Myxococcus sp. NMCA1]WAM23929.1 hypothetical protein OZ403_25665 [Myxococcus sp. NMCA1]
MKILGALVVGIFAIGAGYASAQIAGKPRVANTPDGQKSDSQIEPTGNLLNKDKLHYGVASEIEQWLSVPTERRPYEGAIVIYRPGGGPTVATKFVWGGTIARGMIF